MEGVLEGGLGRQQYIVLPANASVGLLWWHVHVFEKHPSRLNGEQHVAHDLDMNRSLSRIVTERIMEREGRLAESAHFGVNRVLSIEVACPKARTPLLL